MTVDMINNLIDTELSKISIVDGIKPIDLSLIDREVTMQVMRQEPNLTDEEINTQVRSIVTTIFSIAYSEQPKFYEQFAGRGKYQDVEDALIKQIKQDKFEGIVDYKIAKKLIYINLLHRGYDFAEWYDKYGYGSISGQVQDLNEFSHGNILLNSIKLRSRIYGEISDRNFDLKKYFEVMEDPSKVDQKDIQLLGIMTTPKCFIRNTLDEIRADLEVDSDYYDFSQATQGKETFVTELNNIRSRINKEHGNETQRYRDILYIANCTQLLLEKLKQEKGFYTGNRNLLSLEDVKEYEALGFPLQSIKKAKEEYNAAIIIAKLSDRKKKIDLSLSDIALEGGSRNYFK